MTSTPSRCYRHLPLLQTPLLAIWFIRLIVAYRTLWLLLLSRYADYCFHHVYRGNERGANILTVSLPTHSLRQFHTSESWYVSRKGDSGQKGIDQEQGDEQKGREDTCVITESMAN
jgi:hypothetical protein